LESVDGALLEDVTISNITMRDILNAPIFVRLGARMRGPDTIPVGQCRRIIIQNVIAWNVDSRHGVIISGLPGHEIEDLQLSNIKIFYKGGEPKDSINRVVPEYEKDYPEPGPWRVMPSYGFYIRHAKSVKLSDVEVRYEKEDGRPPFMLDDVKGAELRFIKAQKANGTPVVVLKNVSDIILQQVAGLKNVNVKTAENKSL